MSGGWLDALAQRLAARPVPPVAGRLLGIGEWPAIRRSLKPRARPTPVVGFECWTSPAEQHMDRRTGMRTMHHAWGPTLEAAYLRWALASGHRQVDVVLP